MSVGTIRIKQLEPLVGEGLTKSQNITKTISSSESKEKKVSFGDELLAALEEVSKVQNDADQAIDSLMRGENNVGIHETMIAVEKADINLRLMVAVKTKAVEAYKEIMRTGV